MNKFLVFAMVFAVFAMSFVAAQVPPPTQPIVVNIDPAVVVAITPSQLEFGNVPTGTTNRPAINGPIMFDAAGSNSNVHIAVTDVTGFPFEDGLKLDGDDPLTKSWDLLCNAVINICNHTPATTVPTLDVETGSVVGEHLGTIEYTITGTPPGP